MKNLDDEIVNNLFVSAINLMTLFCLESDNMKDINSIFEEVAKSLNDNNREDALFNCLKIQSDDVKKAVAQCLFVIDMSEFDFNEVQ